MMSTTALLILIGIVVVFVALIIFAFARQYRKVGPNEVLIISGGRKRTITEPDGTKIRVGYRMHIGGGTFVLPMIETAQVLPLETYTLNLKCEDALTAQGIMINAVGLAQVKVDSSEHSIRMAAEQFLGKGAEGIRDVAAQVLEGCMRAALGSLTVEQIYRNREEFAETVSRSAEDDFAKMGLALLSFSLQDISDKQGYLEALGRPRIAQVKRDAAVAQAETDKDATIKAAIARKEGDVVKYQAETEIADASRAYEIKRAEFQTDINQKRAEADMAYELQRHRMNQQIKKEEAQTRLIEKEQAIRIEEKEIIRKEMELEASVKKAADARKYQVQAEAEAESFRIEAEAKGKAEAQRLEGLAEAETMRRKADAWKDYNQAAIYQMIIEAMPELARAVSEPLSKVDKITVVSSGDGSTGTAKITGQVAEVLAQLPTIIESLSGVNIAELLKNISTRGAAGTENPPKEEGS